MHLLLYFLLLFLLLFLFLFLLLFIHQECFVFSLSLFVGSKCCLVALLGPFSSSIPPLLSILMDLYIYCPHDANYPSKNASLCYCLSLFVGGKCCLVALLGPFSSSNPPLLSILMDLSLSIMLHPHI